MENNYHLVCQRRDGRKWVTTYETNDALTIYERLANALKQRYIMGSKYYTRITQHRNYGDDTRNIIIYSKYGTREIYRVNA